MVNYEVLVFATSIHTLAYYNMAKITALKSIIVLAQDKF